MLLSNDVLCRAVSCVCSHAPASQQPAVLAAIEKGVVKLSLEECVTITQYTLAHVSDLAHTQTHPHTHTHTRQDP